MMTQLDKLLHPHDQQRIGAAIEAAERRAAVEVLVHVEDSCRYPDARAGDLLRAVKLTRGDRRPYLFVLLLAQDRRCIVVADDKIRALSGTRVWIDVINRLTIDLLHGKLGQGLADAITRLSHILAGHFPAARDERWTAAPGREALAAAPGARGR